MVFYLRWISQLTIHTKPITFLHEKAAFLPEGGLISKSNQLINSKKNHEKLKTETLYFIAEQKFA
jgi:hypothetical protein